MKTANLDYSILNEKVRKTVHTVTSLRAQSAYDQMAADASSLFDLEKQPSMEDIDSFQRSVSEELTVFGKTE